MLQGVPVTYIPWPSQFIRAFIRRNFDKDKLGDAKYREKMNFKYEFLLFLGGGDFFLVNLYLSIFRNYHICLNFISKAKSSFWLHFEVSISSYRNYLYALVPYVIKIFVSACDQSFRTSLCVPKIITL